MKFQILNTKYYILNSNGGFATFEILIAMTLIILLISTILPLLSGEQSITVDSQTNQEALYKAKDLLENARAASLSDFASVSTIASVNDDIYTKRLTVVDIDSSKKQVTSNVAWNTGGKNLAVTLTTLLTNPVLGGDTCSPTLSGDWTNPQLLGTADVGENNGGTDVDIVSKKAYITADAAAAGKHDFYIVDVSDPNLSNLPILGSINTGPGLAAVHVAGKYAYVANMSTVTQLQVIDITLPLTPSSIKKSMNVKVLDDTSVGNSIFYNDKKIYLGLTKASDGPEFYVVDVSDPLIPSVKAWFETNTQVTDIKVKDGIAYLAVPDDPVTVAVKEQLKILDVSQADSGVITQINTFGPNPTTMSGQSLYISKDGKTLYFGEGGANPSNDDQFFILNVDDPNNIEPPINSRYIDTSNDVTVNAITIRTNLAFMVTSDPNLGFQIWDLSNLSSPTPYGSINVEQTSTGGMDCEGNYMYIAQKSNKALQIVGPGGTTGKVNPTISTTIYDDATNLPVTSVPAGTTVYDKATITGSAGTPTGNVDFILYTNKDNCTGKKEIENKPLVSGEAQSSSYATSNKSISYKVYYYGDANYNSRYGPCEPLEVIP